MISFTFEHIKLYSIFVTIFTIIYLILYYKKGINKTIIGYIYAIFHCIEFAVCFIFIIIGFTILIGIIQGKMEILAAILSIGWFIICIFITKRNVYKDFNVIIPIKFDNDPIGLLFRAVAIIIIPIFIYIIYNVWGNWGQVIGITIVGIIMSGGFWLLSSIVL